MARRSFGNTHLLVLVIVEISNHLHGSVLPFTVQQMKESEKLANARAVERAAEKVERVSS